ncbi:anthranilate synthase component I family protein [Bacteroidia bacterium]|nr:anthranilate synthase component I family protein [Bacteroidia bacterium]
MLNQTALSKLIQKSKGYSTSVICCSNGNKDVYGTYEIISGFGAKKTFTTPKSVPKSGLHLGICSYDLKKEFHQLTSENPGFTSFPDFFFFEPEYTYKEDHEGNITSSFDLNKADDVIFKKAKNIENWEASLSKEEYLKAIAKIKGDIKNGAYYELNYCMHFSASISNELDIYSLFLEINERTQSPFAAFVKINNSFLLCFSPERFLKKQNSILLSQPIKGTLKRQTPESNKRLESFINAPKERAENIMIVDLVRNDLSRICKPNSVQVPELCALKTFSHVHHLVSSVIGELQNETSFEDILEATFPMGSMTGAPKREVMQHIEEYESFKRGLYSGSIGYIEDGNFDLNVVIRSLQVHHNKMHYCVGGAIVYDSIAEEEYQECIAKRNGIMNSD